MRVVAMVSGGKDSCYNMMQCVAEGHEIVALANIHPKDKDELDSFMYQTVGHMGIEVLAEAIELPLYRKETRGESKQTGKEYVPCDDDDEVEDLYNLLKQTKDELNVEAVAVGAIFSDYQRVRVENCCVRLNLVPLAYLWRRDQTELLQEMIDCHINAIIIKVASLGLLPDRHLGKTLRDMQPHLMSMHEKYGLNVCGEGGEYETFTLDCPLFKQRIVIEDMQTVVSSSDPVCPVGYINFTQLRLAPKSQTCDVIVKRSLDYLNDLNESSYSDLSDPDLSETELEIIEQETRMRESFSRDDLSRSNSISQSVPHGSSSRLSVRLSCTEDNATTQLPLSPMMIKCEEEALTNRPTTVKNGKGWMWIAGLQGYGTTVVDGMSVALQSLRDALDKNNYQLKDCCYITLYMRNISEYAQLNDVYLSAFNFYNPPTRVCVELPLPSDCQVIIEVVAYKELKQIPGDNDGRDHRRHTMHVQGISHWAPANIGPYSQSTRIDQITYISGQIALIPGSMTIVEGGIRTQCKLTLRHISRIARAMNANGQLRDVVQGICFITHPSYVTEARRQWERRTANAIVDYIVVPALPRQALVEWQVWAHAHNDSFDYEETGCSLAEFTISVRRRWNYENNCAAIVCYASTGMATSTSHLTEPSEDVLNNHRSRAKSLTASQMTDILSYCLTKLLKGYPSRREDCQPGSEQLPVTHLKIFYDVSASPPVTMLIDAVEKFRTTNSIANYAFSILPACSLTNFSTFLSICGIRHE